MMAQWLWQDQDMEDEQEPGLTTEQQLVLVRRDLAQLERRVAFVEATINSIRSDDAREAP